MLYFSLHQKLYNFLKKQTNKKQTNWMRAEGQMEKKGLGIYTGVFDLQPFF